MENELKKTLIEIAEKEAYENDIALIKFDKWDYKDGLIKGSEIQLQLMISFFNWKENHGFQRILDRKYIVKYNTINIMVFNTLKDLYQHWCTTDEYKQVLLTIKNEIK